MKPFSVEQISQAIETAYNFEDVFEKSSGSVVFVFDDLDGLIEVEIVPDAKASDKYRQGIHLSQIDNDFDLGHRLRAALEECFKDGFGRIYLHGKAS